MEKTEQEKMSQNELSLYVVAAFLSTFGIYNTALLYALYKNSKYNGLRAIRLAIVNLIESGILTDTVLLRGESFLEKVAREIVRHPAFLYYNQDLINYWN